MINTDNDLEWLYLVAEGSTIKWIQRAVKSIRDKGYLSLGDFFATITDFELKAILRIASQSNDKCFDLKGQINSVGAIFFITKLACYGEGLPFATEYSPEGSEIFISYALKELTNREILTDAELNLKRKKYTMERYVDC